MDILEGVVSRLRSTIEINGGGNDSSVTTTHVTIFHLSGHPVKIKSRETVLVNESDNIIVAGKANKGIFQTYAYINTTTGISGDIGLYMHYFWGLTCSLTGVFTMYKFSSPFFGVVPQIGAAVFIGIGLYMFYKGTQISKASKLLRAMWYP